MKQIVQDLKDGKTLLEEVPAPQVRRNHVLIRTHRSLVSLGTERMLVEFGKANWLDKARQQPEKVKQVLEKVKSDGLMPTVNAVFNKLGEPMPLGYCNAGEVIGVGEGVTEFKIGDRVASNGQHAEVVCMPKNLVAKIPDGVSYEEASFAVIGAIGLQGIRLVNPTMGETVVVIGLGLIGLLAAELLIANGCRVIGFDFDQSKIDLAKTKGILAYNSGDGSDPVKTVESLTNDSGADAVLITASTKSNEVIHQSALMCRKRGRIVLVGVIGLELSRDDFYKKELSFQVSCAYGAGRYDDLYEAKGVDYPLPYVRWTAQRNFETILFMIASGRLNVQPLITERLPLQDYLKVYGGDMKGGAIASILEYQATEGVENRRIIPLSINANFGNKKGVIGIIGAGNFAKMTMLPALKGSGAHFKYVASAGGLTGLALAKKYGFTHATTDYHEILKDPDVDTVLITTRHDLHARMTLDALAAGKHVFVEKPLAIRAEDLDKIVAAYDALPQKPQLTVGFNRRFSPYMEKAKQLLGGSNAPMNVIATMNAGFIPADFWVHDMQTGGGRIIGEACHYIDLITFLTGSSVSEVVMNAMGTQPEENTDNAAIILKYANGAQGIIHYFANGHKTYSKERVEIYSQGRTLIMDNFRRMDAYGFKGFSSMKSTQDKGHAAQFKRLIKSVQSGGQSLIPFQDIINTSRASFAAIESLKTGAWVKV
jgi:predicted dehydrogenase/threonine dehydrogenase-like Zn-dependent dehydrogenase